jgi:hypothetical protein
MKRHINQLLDENNIIFYTRYVDDIFIIYNTDRSTPEKIHEYLNNLHPKLEFTPTVEENKRISFLDLITRQPSAIEIDIYRTPTATNIKLTIRQTTPPKTNSPLTAT